MEVDKALEVLGEIGPAAANSIPAIGDVLKSNTESYTQATAAEALGKLRNPAAIPFLIAALEIDDDYVRSQATDALAKFGHEASAGIPALVRAVRNHDWNAARALGEIDAEGVSTPVLIETLGSMSPGMRRFAAIGLGHIGRKASAADDALRSAFKDADPGVRIEAARAYWSITGVEDEPVQVLRSAILNADKWIVQMWAADALAAIGPAARPAIPELIWCLDSSARYVVTSSATALGMIGPAAASAGQALSTKLDRCTDDYSCVCLARALWRINQSERSLPLLKQILTTSQDFMALSVAAETVGEMGQHAEAAKPLLRPLLKDSSSFVREAAATALKRLEAP
jgi:HEAT repeat protein